MSNLTQLEETVAVFGAGPSRWPAGREAELNDALQSQSGQLLLHEAVALETALSSRDDSPAFDGDALLGRIMSATVDAPTIERGVAGARVRGSGVSRGWISAGALAAALLVGVFAGINGIGAVVTSDGVSLADSETTLSSDDALLADLAFSSDLDLGDDV